MFTDNSTPKSDQEFFHLRKEGKIYISKAFKLSEGSTEIRNVKIVFENSSIVIAGEIDVIGNYNCTTIGNWECTENGNKDAQFPKSKLD